MLFACAAAVGVLLFVFVVVNAARDLMQFVAVGQIPFTTAFELILLLVPYAATYALPIGMLTGVLLTLGRLSADSEITAMRAAGLSLTRIARPILILGALGCALGLYINFEAMPWSRVRYQTIRDETLRANPLNLIVPKTFIRDFNGMVVYVGSKQGQEISDLWIWKLNARQQVNELGRAQSGRINYDAKTNDLVLTAFELQITKMNPDAPEVYNGRVITPVSQEMQPARLPLDEYFNRGGTRRQKTSWMTYEQLVQERLRLAAKTVPAAEQEQLAKDRMKIEFTLQEKFTTAVAVFTFALFGVPLGIKVGRRETSANLGVAVIMALGYYLLTVCAGWLDGRPDLRPDLLLWGPNVIFLALGVLLFSRIGRK